MYKTVQDVVKDQKYLKLNECGEFVIDYPAKRLNVIDFHTHLSNIIPFKKGDPERTTDKQLQYSTLPPIEKLNLDVPYWTDFDQKDINGIRALFKHIVYGLKIFNDIAENGNFENCFRSQEENLIQKNVLLPLSSKKNDFSNVAIQTARKYPDRFIPFCSVHPLDHNVREKIFGHKENGAKGYKLKITDLELKNNFEPLLEVFKVCYDANLPIILHTGALTKTNYENMISLQRKLMLSTRVELFGELLSKLPDDFIFIFGHSGISEYKLVVEYMKKFPATYTEVSCQTSESIKYMMNEVGSKRILYGSDWPALPQAFTLSRVLLATENDTSARENILFNNAKTLLNL